MLDEIHQADPKEVVGAIYQLANESGKQRLNRDANAKRRRTWCTMVLSSGEIDIATMAAKHSSSPLPAGAEVRLPSIPIDGQDMWPNLYGSANTQELMARLQKALLKQHGTAIRPYLENLATLLAQNDGTLEQEIDALRETFYTFLPGDADPQVKEVAALRSHRTGRRTRDPVEHPAMATRRINRSVADGSRFMGQQTRRCWIDGREPTRQGHSFLSFRIWRISIRRARLSGRI